MKDHPRLPESELDIMLVIWDLGDQAAAPAILERLERPLTASALHSYLKRLEDKGYLACTKEGKTNRYTPLVSREAYQRQEGKDHPGQAVRGLPETICRRPPRRGRAGQVGCGGAAGLSGGAGGKGGTVNGGAVSAGGLDLSDLLGGADPPAGGKGLAAAACAGQGIVRGLAHSGPASGDPGGPLFARTGGDGGGPQLSGVSPSSRAIRQSAHCAPNGGICG